MTKHKMIVNGFRGLVTTALVAVLVACGGGGNRHEMRAEVDINAFLVQVDADTNASSGPHDVVEMGFDITTGNGTTTAYTAEEWEIEEEDD